MSHKCWDIALNEMAKNCQEQGIIKRKDYVRLVRKIIKHNNATAKRWVCEECAGVNFTKKEEEFIDFILIIMKRIYPNLYKIEKMIAGAYDIKRDYA
jgi:hypothetical protein